jgi:hypothetical protein
MNSPTFKEKRFDWPLCYEAENYIVRQLDSFLNRNAFARRLAQRMADETGTLFIDWVDHLTVPSSELAQLEAVGFADDAVAEIAGSLRAFWHPEALLPRVLVDDGLDVAASPLQIAVRCESIDDFVRAHGLGNRVEGLPFSRLRRVLVSEESGTRLEAVERRGYRGYVISTEASSENGVDKAMELWRTRPREFVDATEGFRKAHALLDLLVAMVGRDQACHAVFAMERNYWESRNGAARIQKARQDKLGLGWANHDHHTFRSSRAHFVDLMRALEKLGFERRERYYAGAQAGWGAQILEQPIEGIVAFCDVDLEAAETEIDFSRQPLPAVKRLGTIGLWVGLHGESFLDAGMHHLECRFDYQLLREQLESAGIHTMKPFSDFEFLKQAFTDGERWQVRPERLEQLKAHGLISAEQFEQFRREGAIGSHLENLQRKGGFKGFNQKSVSVIIQATDPRIQKAVH